MTRKRKCHSKSNSFVAAAEQVCLQPVVEHRQRRGRRNIAWQAIPHLCSSSRKGTTSDSCPTTGRNVKLFSGVQCSDQSIIFAAWRQRAPVVSLILPAWYTEYEPPCTPHRGRVCVERFSRLYRAHRCAQLTVTAVEICRIGTSGISGDAGRQ